MQVMPATGRSMGLADVQSPQANLEASARYLKQLQARFGNDLRLVLAAYNAGEGAVERHGRRVPPYAETQAYVRNVLAVYTELRRRFGGQA
jgi:soluble lytic murein transglycosylase-like protein